jgi:hypothetical protein
MTTCGRRCSGILLPGLLFSLTLLAGEPFAFAQAVQTAPSAQSGTATETGTSTSGASTGTVASTGTAANIIGSVGTIGSTALSTQTQAFEAERQTLAGQFSALLANGATLDQIQAWRQQNAAQFASQRQQAQAIAASQPAQPISYITDVDLPANASQTMDDFLTARANLFNLRAQIHNQQLQATGSVDDAAGSATFTQQNAAALQAQAQRAQALALEADRQPMVAPPPLVLPPNATANLTAFLTLRDQLMRAQIAVHNQNLQADASTRQAALLAWKQVNQGQFQQLQALAQNLNQPSS